MCINIRTTADRTNPHPLFCLPNISVIVGAKKEAHTYTLQLIGLTALPLVAIPTLTHDFAHNLHYTGIYCQGWDE